MKIQKKIYVIFNRYEHGTYQEIEGQYSSPVFIKYVFCKNLAIDNDFLNYIIAQTIHVKYNGNENNPQYGPFETKQEVIAFIKKFAELEKIDLIQLIDIDEFNEKLQRIIDQENMCQQLESMGEEIPVESHLSKKNIIKGFFY